MYSLLVNLYKVQGAKTCHIVLLNVPDRAGGLTTNTPPHFMPLLTTFDQECSKRHVIRQEDKSCRNKMSFSSY